MILTMGERMKISRLRGMNWNWRAIANEFQVSVDTIRSAVDPEWGHRRAEQIKRARERGSKAPEKLNFNTARQYNDAADINRRHVPPEVLEERERAIEASYTQPLGASVFGDPVFHRSALGRRQCSTK